MDKRKSTQLTTIMTEEKTLIEYYRKSSDLDRKRLLTLTKDAAEVCARLARRRIDQKNS